MICHVVDNSVEDLHRIIFTAHNGSYEKVMFSQESVCSHGGWGGNHMHHGMGHMVGATLPLDIPSTHQPTSTDF